jgi:hypothetical protein
MISAKLHQFWVKKIPPGNSIWNTTVPLLSYSCMFQEEIRSQQLEICKSVNANDMGVTKDLNSFGEIIAQAHCSVDDKNVGCK